MIEFDALIDKVRDLAAREPLKVSYCEYFTEDTGEAECLIGHALAELGVSIPPHFNGRLAYHIYWPSLGIANPTKRQIKWLDEVQALQDALRTWSLAVAGADLELVNA